ncbi:MAG: DUF3810 domain-containing protein [Clostridia bacterium]|nr:DUF3810 domain-containing protein [Clostridia bacterium]
MKKKEQKKQPSKKNGSSFFSENEVLKFAEGTEADIAAADSRLKETDAEESGTEAKDSRKEAEDSRKEAKDSRKEFEGSGDEASGSGSEASGSENEASGSGSEASGSENEAEYEEPVPRKKLPTVSYVFFGTALLSLVLYIIALVSPAFADWFTRYPAGGVRAALAFITGFLPFSLGEFTVFMIPFTLVFFLVYVVRRYSDSWHNVGVFALTMLSVLSVFFSLFVFTLGTGYKGATLDKKLEIERNKVLPDELKATALILAEKLKEEETNVTYVSNGFSMMPYFYSEMNEKLMTAYDRLSEKYDFVQRMTSAVKPVMHSEPWTYTHITGVYTFFTGESNININMPDYTIPFTAAHELAHQRGIAREDEANFIAYLACTESDDPYIRYSGYLNMYEYVASALYSADSDSYWIVNAKLSSEIKTELKAYSTFFDKYRHNVAATVSGAINDTYLKVQGTVGERSYGLVVDLCVAYYKSF